MIVETGIIGKTQTKLIENLLTFSNLDDISVFGSRVLG